MYVLYIAYVLLHRASMSRYAVCYESHHMRPAYRAYWHGDRGLRCTLARLRRYPPSGWHTRTQQRSGTVALTGWHYTSAIPDALYTTYYYYSTCGHIHVRYIL